MLLKYHSLTKVLRYGGDVLPDYQSSEATHLVVDKEVSLILHIFSLS